MKVSLQRAIFLFLSGLIILFMIQYLTIQQLNESIEELTERITSLETTVEEFKSEMDTRMEELNKNIEELQTLVSNLQSSVGIENEEDPLPYSDEEIDLIALVTMAEAENQPEEGKRLVIDVVLNRVESPRFANTVTDVIYAPNQFTSMTNGRVDRCYVQSDIVQLVKEEIVSRSNSDVLYFRSGHYHNFGTPIVHVGSHYFSGL